MELVDLTKYFDKIKVNVKADLSDWQNIRKELRGKDFDVLTDIKCATE
jgi:hypothetical protein